MHKFLPCESFIVVPLESEKYRKGLRRVRLQFERLPRKCMAMVHLNSLGFVVGTIVHWEWTIRPRDLDAECTHQFPASLCHFYLGSKFRLGSPFLLRGTPVRRFDFHLVVLLTVRSADTLSAPVFANDFRVVGGQVELRKPERRFCVRSEDPFQSVQGAVNYRISMNIFEFSTHNTLNITT